MRHSISKSYDLFLSELKNLPYFHGIDWQLVAEGKSDPPFDPSTTELELDNPQNKTELFNNEMDDTLAAIIAEKFQSKSQNSGIHRNI